MPGPLLPAAVVDDRCQPRHRPVPEGRRLGSPPVRTAKGTRHT